jgi:hypothetical protein
MKPLPVRAWAELVVALAAGILGIVTIFWQDWIEALTGWDPDRHSGGVEWLAVAALLAISAVLGTAAARHWRLAPSGSG